MTGRGEVFFLSGEDTKYRLVHKIVVHKLVYFIFFVYICSRIDIYYMERHLYMACLLKVIISQIG